MKDPELKQAASERVIYYCNKLVVDFIEKRFPSTNDANWMNGNCYWFARILCDCFPFLQIGYDPIIGHFFLLFNIMKF